MHSRPLNDLLTPKLTIMQTKKLIYFYDALCGWCYGFSPILQKLHEQYRDVLDFEVVSGGMVLGDREGPIGEVAPYIKDAYKQVEMTAGVIFGKAFLEDVLEEGSTLFSSWYPAVALEVFRARQPGEAIFFARALQKAIYSDGLPPADPSAYRSLAAQFDLDVDSFIRDMDDPAFADAARAQFQTTASFKVGGFPTLILQNGAEYFMVSRGYLAYDILDFRLGQILSAQNG